MNHVAGAALSGRVIPQNPGARNAAPLLSIIVPVYNELATIDEALRRVVDAPVTKQVVVVDDGSTDGTTEALQHWARNGQVELVVHDCNLGKGAAIRAALARVWGRFTIIQDADLEYDPLDYPALLQPLLSRQADVVYGSRYSQAGQVNRNRNRTFRWGVGVLNLVVRALYGVRLTDEATCYKVFPTELLRALDLQCERFEFCPEVTAKLCRMGSRIHEVPISYHARTIQAGKKLRLWDGIAALRTLWNLRNWVPPESSTSRDGPL